MRPSVPLVRWPGWLSPEAVHARLARSHEETFWLDAGPDAVDGWSWVGFGEVETDAAAVRDVRCAVAVDGASTAGGPFRGGWVGWRSYDPAAAAAGAPAASDDLDVPEDCWLRVRVHFAFDHRARQVWWCAADEDGPYAQRVLEAAQRDAGSADEPDDDDDRHARTAPRFDAHARHTSAEYAALIEQCREAIGRGDAYQLCLTTRFSIERAGIDPLEVYDRLRHATPAHHGGLIRVNGAALASASPERFLEIRSGRLRTRPIKGTRPRGGDGATDAALAAELLASEKERAENVMIVDLMRNDLSRVSAAGSVRVEDLLIVESYAAVHQLVSTVSGELVPDATMGQVWDAAFPAGSMTGAPKLSAMTILHGLERGPRGVFAGLFGWIGCDGGADLAMVIRSIVIHARGAYVGAGGGITWRSIAAEEVAEVAVKARGPLRALGSDIPPGWSDGVR